VRVAVVGYGYWGPNLVRTLAAIDGCTSIVVCDERPERLKACAAQYPTVDVRALYADVVDDPSIDAVVIATPVRSHDTLATAALSAGKHCLVEKPLATTAAAARQLVSLATDRGAVLMCGHTYLYSAPVQTIRRLVESGELGSPLYIQSSRVSLVHRSDVSALWDLGPHDLSILCEWLHETPDWAAATGRSGLQGGTPEVVFLNLGFPSGVVANVHLSWLAPTKVRHMTLVGTEKMVIYEDSNVEEPVKVYDKGINLTDPDNDGECPVIYRSGDAVVPWVEVVEPLRGELTDFLRRAELGDGPGPAEETVVGIVATLEAAEASLAAGSQRVPVALDVLDLRVRAARLASSRT
jgi:predicted dehydrogenase